MLNQLSLQPFARNFWIVLSRNQHRIQTLRHTLRIVFNSYLRFTIRTKMRHRTVFTNLRKPLRQTVGKIYWQWHIRISFVTCVAKHYTLIPRTLSSITLLTRGFTFANSIQASNTLVNFGALLSQRNHNTARIRVKTNHRTRIPNVTNHATHNARNIGINFAANLTKYHKLSNGRAHFYRNMRMLILSKHVIQNSVSNLIA